MRDRERDILWSLRSSANEVLVGTQQRIDEFTRRRWEALAGSQLETMLGSRAGCRAFLTHSDSKLREAALSIMLWRWPSPELGREAHRVFFRDSDESVREMALLVYVECSGEADRTIAKLLATVIRNESEVGPLRQHAYIVLRTDRFSGTLATVVSSARGFRFPEDVDWKYVDSWLLDEESR